MSYPVYSDSLNKWGLIVQSTSLLKRKHFICGHFYIESIKLHCINLWNAQQSLSLVQFMKRI